VVRIRESRLIMGRALRGRRLEMGLFEGRNLGRGGYTQYQRNLNHLMHLVIQDFNDPRYEWKCLIYS
jgi:hypothetical protein